MKKLTNKEKYNNYIKRKILRVLIIVLLLSIIVLSILALFKKISIIYPLVIFLIARLLTNYRNKLSFKDK